MPMDNSDDRPERSSSPASSPRRAKPVIELDEQQKHEAILEMARRFETYRAQLDALVKKRK